MKQIGICNICLQMKDLTWDHVPPKGGIELTRLEAKSFYNSLTNKRSYPKFIQGGLKYQTICADCNSLLGREYDPVLNKLNWDVYNYAKSTLQLLPYTYVKTKPVRLIKGVLGHLLAAKKQIDAVQFDIDSRSLVLDKTLKIPEWLNLFYWIYPYNMTTIVRDFALYEIEKEMNLAGFFQLLKYFPMGFMFSSLKDYHNLPNLIQFQEFTLDQEAEIRIDLSAARQINWPETTENGKIVLLSKESEDGISAKPR